MPLSYRLAPAQPLLYACMCAVKSRVQLASKRPTSFSIILLIAGFEKPRCISAWVGQKRHQMRPQAPWLAERHRRKLERSL